MWSEMTTDVGNSARLGSVLVVSEKADHTDIFKSAFADRLQKSISLREFISPDFVLPGRETLIVLDCDRVTEQILACLHALHTSRPCPVIVFAETGDAATAQATMRAGASACVIDGLQAHRVETLAAIALERFRQSEEIRTELHKTKESVEARKYIERAKGVLMKSRGITEDEAYRMIRSTAMKQSKTMREVAESILSIADIF